MAGSEEDVDSGDVSIWWRLEGVKWVAKGVFEVWDEGIAVKTAVGCSIYSRSELVWGGKMSTAMGYCRRRRVWVPLFTECMYGTNAVLIKVSTR